MVFVSECCGLLQRSEKIKLRRGVQIEIERAAGPVLQPHFKRVPALEYPALLRREDPLEKALKGDLCAQTIDVASLCAGLREEPGFQ